MTFEYGNGNGNKPTNVVLEYNTSSLYSEDPERTRYTFNGWNKPERMAVENITITTPWRTNEYTVFFEGTPKQHSKGVTYNEEYKGLPETSRVGYNFAVQYTGIEDEDE